MTSVKIISLCYTDPVIVAASYAQYLKTAGLMSLPNVSRQFMVVDHDWPLMGALSRRLTLIGVAKSVNGTCVWLDKNIGATPALNWAVRHGGFPDADLVLTYDGDSFPETPEWLVAMIDVMRADPAMATLSLWPPGLGVNPFHLEMIAGHAVKTFDHPEMFSVTMWRGSFIKAGVEGHHKYYGQIEIPTFERAQALGMKNGYLPDFKESPHPIPHPQIYTDWKHEHVTGRFAGNFPQYLEFMGVRA